MKALLRVFPTLMLMVVGATSFLLSYVAIRDVSVALGAVPAHLAWAVPVCIDGGILAGSAAIWSSSYHRRRRDPLAFLTVATLLATSVLVNVSHAGDAPLAKWIAALPPLILLACLEIVAAQHRRDLSEDPAADPIAVAVSSPAETETAAPAPVVAQPAVPPAPHRAKAAAPAPAVTAPAAARPSRPAPAGKVAEPAAEPAPQQPLAVEDRTPHLVPDLPSRTAATRPRRISAAAPGEPDPATPAAETAGGDRVKALFSAHVDAGGDPQDRQLAQSLAEQTGMSVQYVRRVLRPLRDQLAS